ncbi:epidermal growth factor receptor-like isoform X3 [Halichondria panicea]
MSIDEVLEGLRERFCGCIHIRGSVLISMRNFNAMRQLNSDDFNMFYRLEQVSGAVQFLGIPDTSDIILPNLRIIRAEELVVGQFSLLVQDSIIGRLILPKLTQITKGNVIFQNTGSLCNYLTVRWSDIIDGGGTLMDGTGTCSSMAAIDPALLPDCGGCGSGHCWSEEYCQTLTKDCNGCSEDRCYTVDESASTKQCCNSHCAAGCDGPTATHCFACKNFDNNGTCVTQCPPEVIYDRNLFRVVPNPDYRLSLGNLCVEECPFGFLDDRGSCVRECLVGYIASEDGRSCEECNGPCPRECAGLSNVDTDSINADNLERFRGCTIITSGAIIIGQELNFDYSQFEVLSTIQEIRGPVRIQGLPVTSFPYLRNLKRIDTTNSTVKVELGCGPDTLDPYALDLTNNQFQSIDLSSLEEIRGDGLRYAVNQQLCYVGDLLSYLADPINQTQCITRERRPPNECSDAGLVCHVQCSSTFNCWGPMDHQCDSCANYQYKNRCVSDCSAVIATLPENSSGLFQNEANNRCEPCDDECLGGCSGGTGPEFCNACQNLFIRTNETADQNVICLLSCPVSTHLRSGTLECVPCHEGCDPFVGCIGPLPYLDLENGCLDCDRVILNRNGTQNMCVPRFCPDGTYSSTLQPGVQSELSIIGNLQIGSDICLPCNELCEVCVREGTDVLSCPQCEYARSGDECVRECNSVTEYLQSESLFCVPCGSVCNDCTGPTVDNCIVECTSDQNVSATCVPVTVSESTSTAIESTGTTLIPPSTASIATEIITSFVAVILVFLITMVVFIAVIVRLRRKRSGSKNTLTSETPNPSNDSVVGKHLLPLVRYSEIPQDLLLSETEKQSYVNIFSSKVFPYASLTIEEEIGKGAFGRVYLGNVINPEDNILTGSFNQKIAIKTIKNLSSKDELNAFLEESLLMKDFQHPNILGFFGVCFDTPDGAPYILLPYMANGNLKDYLKKKRTHVTNVDTLQDDLRASTLLRMCMDVANGMEYLSKRKFVHRDLAARNCMVDTELVVKVGDFGLARDIYSSDYYRANQEARIPVKWMAPETLNDAISNEKTDVWSYGVTCWEVFSLGRVPYPGIDNQNVLKHITTGDQRLGKPSLCPLKLYGVIMAQCWQLLPEDRPNFSQLVEELRDYWEEEHAYVMEFLTNSEEVIQQASAIDINLQSNEAYDQVCSVTEPVELQSEMELKTNQAYGSVVTSTACATLSPTDIELQPNNAYGSVSTLPSYNEVHAV